MDKARLFMHGIMRERRRVGNGGRTGFGAPYNGGR
jgi:hypothetical protein